MRLVYRWLLPVAFIGIGIAVLAGLLLPNLPAGTGIRPMVGIVAILLGVHRFVASRTVAHSSRRVYGGERRKPWENHLQ